MTLKNSAILNRFIFYNFIIYRISDSVTRFCLNVVLRGRKPRGLSTRPNPNKIGTTVTEETFSTMLKGVKKFNNFWKKENNLLEMSQNAHDYVLVIDRSGKRLSFYVTEKRLFGRLSLLITIVSCRKNWKRVNIFILNSVLIVVNTLLIWPRWLCLLAHLLFDAHFTSLINLAYFRSLLKESKHAQFEIEWIKEFVRALRCRDESLNAMTTITIVVYAGKGKRINCSRIYLEVDLQKLSVYNVNYRVTT